MLPFAGGPHCIWICPSNHHEWHSQIGILELKVTIHVHESQVNGVHISYDPHGSWFQPSLNIKSS